MYCRCVVSKVKSPNAVCERLSSTPSPADSVDVHHGARRLTLATRQVSTTVIVRSSKPGPPSYCAFSRLRRYEADSDWPSAHGRSRLADTFRLP